MKSESRSAPVLTTRSGSDGKTRWSSTRSSSISRIDLVGFDALGERLDGTGKLVFAAETDPDLDRRIGGCPVVRSTDGDLSWRVDRLEVASQRRNRFGVEDAHVNRHARCVLERPLEAVGERLVPTVLEQVAFGDDEGDVLGDPRGGGCDR